VARAEGLAEAALALVLAERSCACIRGGLKSGAVSWVVVAGLGGGWGGCVGVFGWAARGQWADDGVRKSVIAFRSLAGHVGVRGSVDVDAECVKNLPAGRSRASPGGFTLPARGRATVSPDVACGPPKGGQRSGHEGMKSWAHRKRSWGGVYGR